MRYRLMATYGGAPYEAGVGPSDSDVVLFAACPPPEELGFEPATGHWRKQLRVQDVQALWESRPIAMYRGQRCIVLDDLGDRLHIAYLGHDSFQAHELGYWQVDRGVFELVTPRDEVTDITEERADYPGYPPGSADEPPAAAGYGPAMTGHGPATADYVPAMTDYGPAAADFGTATDYAPATADYGTPAADYDPAAADYDPAGAHYDPAAADFGTTMTDYAPATADYLPATADYAPATADYLPATADYAPATADYLPATADNGTAAADYDPLNADYGPATTDFGVIFPADGLTPAPVLPDFGTNVSPGLAPLPQPPDFEASALPGRSPLPQPPDFEASALPGRSPLPNPPGFTVVAPSRDAPMPLEAAALRAATAGTPPGHTRLTTQQPGATRGFDTPLATRPAPAEAPRPAALELLTVPAGPAAPATPVAPAAPAASVTPAAPVTPAARVTPAAPVALAARVAPAPPRVPATPELPLNPSVAAAARRQRSARSRMATQRIFTELAALAAIPAAAYAVGEEVDGALCLIETATGYEVFSAAGGARHEVRFFEDEESAYFYLFGVLAAEAVRTGLLIPHR